jgi:uncharacterized protein YndB with AHSA1/START domain
MTSPQPTGRIAGNDLILTRTFRAPIADVWRSVTDSESCARWFGRWEGDARPGNTIRLQMLHEKGEPWSNVRIEACDAPRHLAVTTKDDYGEWSLELTLEQAGEITTMTFVHHLSDKKHVGDTGPGWEYYLDMLVAAQAGAALPKFDDYYPSQKEYFLAQVR